MTANAKLKHLSTVANDVIIRTCALYVVISLFLQNFLRFAFSLNIFLCFPKLSADRKLGTSVDKLVEEFEAEYWKPDESTSNISSNGYSRKLVEFCSAKALAQKTCQNIEEKINDGSFSRFTFDMMIAWEMPSSTEEEASTVRTLALSSLRSYTLITITSVGT